MSSDTVRQIKDKLSIVDVVAPYIKLERSGNSLRARCPFHGEKTPSFFLSPERGTYHCFGCGVGGDIFSFVQAIEGVDFSGALKMLAEKAGVEIIHDRTERKDARDRLLELMEASTIFYTARLDDAARTYLHERGLTDETIQSFRLGWAGNGWSDISTHLQQKGFSEHEIVEAGMAKQNDRGLIDKFRNRIMFPIADTAGRVIAFSGRIFGPHASPDAPKYLNSPETPLFHKSRILYGFDKAKVPMRKHSCAILVEGQMDLLASHQAGWANTVAVSGTAFTPEHAQLIKRMTDNMVIALDGDAAGIKAAGKAARAALASGLNVKVAQFPAGMDPADLILQQGPETWSASIREAKDVITFLLDVLQQHTPLADRYRRLVEAVVLPFLADVQSPIAQAQYIHEIAVRLGVPDDAVRAAFQKTPVQPVAPREEKKELSGIDSLAASYGAFDRPRKAYALYLWQQTAIKPDIDAEKYFAELVEGIGMDALQPLVDLSDAEKEALRFAAEAQHAKSVSVALDAQAMLGEILKNIRLPLIRAAIRNAELQSDEALVNELQQLEQQIMKKIAQLRSGLTA